MSTATRTQIPLSTLTASSPVGVYVDLNDAGTAVDQSNGMYIQMPTNIPVTGEMDRIFIYFKNSYSGTVTITVRGGVNPPALRAGLGDYTTGNVTGSTGIAFLCAIESARFAQSDNTIWIDFSASATGTIWAVLVPRGF